jgi:folate-dependent tRNA-U54 methylase TrmFO/GidA
MDWAGVEVELVLELVVDVEVLTVVVVTGPVLDDDLLEELDDVAGLEELVDFMEDELLEVPQVPAIG